MRWGREGMIVDEGVGGNVVEVEDGCRDPGLP